MDHYRKRGFPLTKGFYLALGLLCLAHPVVAQNEAVTDGDKGKKNSKTPKTEVALLGEKDSETSVQAVSSVSGDRVQHRPVFQMESNFSGLLPGLNVGLSQGYPSENRSLSLNGAAPLIVVDGIPRSDANIPVSQIESVTVLKDAVAISALGLSSGNGVVYIKTKRGSVSKMKIEFTGQLAFTQQIFRPEFLGAYDYAKLLNEALANEGRQPMYSNIDLNLYKTGASPFTHPDVDWQKELLNNTSPVQQYNVNFSGGTKNARYFIDVNVFDQAGFLKQDKSINTYDTQEHFKKYSLRTNTDINVTDHTLFSVNLFGQMYRENTPGKMIMSSIYKDMYSTPNNAYPKFNPNGTLGGNKYYPDCNLYGQTILSGYNLYPMTDFNLDVTLAHYFTGKLQGAYLSGTYSYNSTYREQLTRSKQFDVYSYWKDPSDTSPDTDSNYYKIKSGSAQNNSSSYSRINRMQFIDVIAGYDFSIRQHHFKTKAAYTYNDYFVDMVNLPIVKHGFNVSAAYDYDKRYLAEVLFTGTSLNALKKGNTWGFFPTVGLGWNIHKEAWFNAEQIDRLKLRASFGINGNDGTATFYRSGAGTLSYYYYNYIKLYASSGNGAYFGTKPSGWTSYYEANMAYFSKWSTNTRYNLAVDVDAFDNALTGTLEYAYTLFSDVLQIREWKNYNSINGITSPLENQGKYSQQSINASVAYRKQFGDVKVMAEANAAFWWSKIIENGEADYPEPYMRRKGKSRALTYGYVADGLFRSQAEVDQYLAHTKVEGYTPKPGDIRYVDLNNDNVINALDIKGIGSAMPIYFGAYLGAEWKGLSLTTQWNGRTNSFAHIQDSPFGLNSHNAYGQALTSALGRWTPENPNASRPRVSSVSNPYNDRTSTFWLQNSTYLRLKQIELAYQLPEQWTKSIKVEKVKVFASAYNLLTLSPLKGHDPELTSFMNGTGTGIVPNVKAYNFGLNIQF